jgi:hypothetical protein
MKNLFCDSRTLKNEASVEKNFVDRLLLDLGYEDADIRSKTSLKEIKVGKGSKSTDHTYPASAISERMDVKFCIADKGRKREVWIKGGHKVVAFGSILSPPTGERSVGVAEDEEYQFLRVSYQGEVTDGDIISGAECSYATLYQVQSWDILISNMGVGRGAIGIVPPYHAGKFVSNEYTILRAQTNEEAVYYSNLVKTKEILGDILSTTTGMNRGRNWPTIAKVEVPECPVGDSAVAKLVEELKRLWEAHSNFTTSKKGYLDKIAKEMELNGPDAHERWLGFKPPE